MGLYLSMWVLKAKLTLLRGSLIYLPAHGYPGGNTLCDSGTLQVPQWPSVGMDSKTWVLLSYITCLNSFSVFNTYCLGQRMQGFSNTIKQRCELKLTKVKWRQTIPYCSAEPFSSQRCWTDRKPQPWCYCRMSPFLVPSEIRKHSLTIPTTLSDTGSSAHSSLKDTSNFVILI